MKTDRVAELPETRSDDPHAAFPRSGLPSLDVPLTQAVRAVLSAARQGGMREDLLYLERWEISPSPGAAAAMRISQIRRANPALAAAVRAELAALR